MNRVSYVTSGGLKIECLSEESSFEDGIKPILNRIDSRKGAIFSSGFDYPGRHSRWDMGFVDPALEFISRAREFSFQALNEQGAAVLGFIIALLDGMSEIEELVPQVGANGLSLISGRLAPPPKFFPEEKRSRQASIFSVLRRVVSFFHSNNLAGAHLGLYGAFGYDLMHQFEDIQLKHERTGKVADCHLYLPLDLLVVDRKKEIATRYAYSIQTDSGPTASLKGGGAEYLPQIKSGSSELVSDHEPGEFAKKVNEVIEGTKRGDYFEVVLSQVFETSFDGKPTDLFTRMASINPSPYMFLINLGVEQLVGASPELYARVTDGRYETCPIAGTVRRGATALEDADQVLQLISSQKDESELTMCTDVDRNDMARVCKPGSVKVIGRRQLEFYSHLIHTVDHLEGYLAEGFDALDAFQTHMWACTVTGAPKPAALQEIERLENSPRGWYSGAIGVIGFNGNLNTGITLRTAFLREGRASTRAGATLLYGSDPAAEEQETRTKAAAFLAALTHVQDNKNRADGVNQKATPVSNLIEVLSVEIPHRKVFLVDHKDSFVHNLAAYLRELGAEVVTIRSGFPEDLLIKEHPDLVVLSPGPGTPEQFGVPNLVGRLVELKIPVFGVCLGHQGIGQHFGATLSQLPVPHHGKCSRVSCLSTSTKGVSHNGTWLFDGVDSEFEAGRYHSLYLVNDTVPEDLEVVASTEWDDGSGKIEVIPMAVAHRKFPVAGVQFHPESLMTLKGRAGHMILRNVLLRLAGIKG